MGVARSSRGRPGIRLDGARGEAP
jgi:hypothetical protein